MTNPPNAPKGDESPSTAVDHERRVHNGAHALWETEVGLDARVPDMGDDLDEADKDVRDRFEKASEEVIEAKEDPPHTDQPKVGPHVAQHKANG